MRQPLTPARVQAFLKELARSAPDRGSYRVFVVGGGTAILLGWRPSTFDLDLYARDERVFRDIQGIKERLDINVEFARPEDFVPPLSGSDDRHLFVERVGRVELYHYDPYAQLLSKVSRGFAQDLDDARRFVTSGMVDPERFRALVAAIPDKTFAKYPALSKSILLRSVERFLASLDGLTR
ncbi:MAG TPA: DUF6036 family nucleotidyltransferase [Candidatus Polarisedimenticolaceae bacterium]|nr:DUF6036 family nucleotidyltransferase [Candidatus Polarisedimenticolaceae bacterium]